MAAVQNDRSAGKLTPVTSATFRPTHATESLLNFGQADRDLADEFQEAQETVYTMPDGTEVRPNNRDPFYSCLTTHNSHYLAAPNGCLAIHLVYAKHLDTRTIQRLFPNSDHLDYYVRVDFLDKQLYSELIVDVPVGTGRIIFDHLVTFTIEDIAINDGSEAQIVSLHLIAIDESDPQRHIIVASVERPLLDFIRWMISSEMLVLSRPARINETDGGLEGERFMGRLLIKSAFAYGRFGFGYSNQIFDERMEPKDAMAHSLFPRYAPLPSRIQETGNVLRFKPIIPLIHTFPFPEMSDTPIGDVSLKQPVEYQDEEEQTVTEAIPWDNPYLYYIPIMSKELLNDWTVKLRGLKGKTRRRIAYLQQMSAPEPGRGYKTLPQAQGVRAEKSAVLPEKSDSPKNLKVE
ncbi:hypothetical protein RvY_06666 [Ramazzottius varieornatus]|uniref:Uncharacterized protein n=1 Tax=Ramazzottius varieornatus TaxID=947166 RepID=A0A1D1V4T7_RAMVA|nr:hypothetical protein RvY_06666 [Ramazzottius varieornatus]